MAHEPGNSSKKESGKGAGGDEDKGEGFELEGTKTVVELCKRVFERVRGPLARDEGKRVHEPEKESFHESERGSELSGFEGAAATSLAAPLSTGKQTAEITQPEIFAPF